MKKVVGLMLGFMPVSAFGECVPVPDCASIGYTETSCEGDSLKCPFDRTKLKCFPCDSSFRYTCSGENIKNPIGAICNNKYTSCECVAGATFSNGNCVCDASCDTIGNIYYSDGTCSSCNLTDKTPVGIVAYKDENKHLIISLETSIKMTWSATQTDAEGNTIIAYDTDLAGLRNLYYTDSGLTDSEATGQEQTRVIVEAYGENATGVAAVYCYNYAPAGLESSKGQWYLPAAGELHNVIFKNKVSINNGLSVLGIDPLYREFHWSSSESFSSHAWNVNSNVKVVRGHSKATISAISCLFAL